MDERKKNKKPKKIVNKENVYSGLNLVYLNKRNWKYITFKF